METVNSELSLSKKRRKKLIKEEKWKEEQEERIEARKEKRKVMRKRRKELVSLGILEPRRRKIEGQTRSEIGIILDCSFEKEMIEKQLSSTAFQISQCYSRNRTSKKVFDLIVSSWGGALKEYLEKKYPTYTKWAVRIIYK